MAAINENIVGHQTQRGFLSSAISNQRIPNTMLFVGPAGVGKRKVALSFVQQVFCQVSETSACGQCPDCQRVSNEQHESLLLVEPDGTSIKIEQARKIIEFMSLKSLSTKRFIIIDQFDLINTQAANALLKSLEEPPEGTHFILVTQSLSGVLPTVKSRSQIVQFAPLQESELRQHRQAEDWVFKAAQGSFKSLERFADPEMEEFRQSAVSFWRCVAEQRLGEFPKLARDFAADKNDLPLKLLFLQQTLRDAMVVDSQPESVLHQDLSPLLSQLSELAEQELLSKWSLALVQLEADLSRNLDRVLCFEDFAYKVKSQLAGAQ